MSRIGAALKGDLKQSDLGRELINLIACGLADLKRKAIHASQRLSEMPGPCLPLVRKALLPKSFRWGDLAYAARHRNPFGAQGRASGAHGARAASGTVQRRPEQGLRTAARAD